MEDSILGYVPDVAPGLAMTSSFLERGYESWFWPEPV